MYRYKEKSREMLSSGFTEHLILFANYKNVMSVKFNVNRNFHIRIFISHHLRKSIGGIINVAYL